MVSLIPIFDVEFFNSAYENICLIANKTWASNEDDPYRKLNEHLWVQNSKYIRKLHGNCISKRSNVYDVISNSLLTQYDNNQYNVKDKNLCRQNNHQLCSPHKASIVYLNKPISEPWMLDEVEECFTQLTSNMPSMKESHCLTLNNESYGFIDVDIDYNNYGPLPYKIDNAAELQLQMRISHENIRHIWNTNDVIQPASISSSSSLSSCSSSSSLSSSSSSSSSPSSPSSLSSESLSLSSSLLSSTLKNGKCENNNSYYKKQPEQLYLNKIQNVSHCENGKKYDINGQLPVTIKKNLYKINELKKQKKSTTIPILSAEVPEFFPKYPGTMNNMKNNDTVTLQNSLYSNERNFQEHIFQFSRPPLSNVNAIYQSPNMSFTSLTTPLTAPLMRPLYHWLPPAAPPPPPPPPIQIPFCSMTPQSIYPVIGHPHPIQLHEKLMIQPNQINNIPTPIPVYQRPPELYLDQKQRNKSQGVDFNNLILLTKSAMKARRNQSKNPQQSSSFILESRQPNLKSETDVLQWLNKGYPKRAKEFLTINSLVSDLHNCEEKYIDNTHEGTHKPDLSRFIITQHNNYNNNKFNNIDNNYLSKNHY